LYLRLKAALGPLITQALVLVSVVVCGSLGVRFHGSPQAERAEA
jgi:hypothetical protein